MRPPDLTFTVYGTPQHQGNLGRGRNGFTFERNKNIKPWRAQIIDAAQTFKTTPDGHPVFPGAIAINARFYFGRRSSDFGTGRNAGVLKESAPIWKISKPDGDHLDRALWDAIKLAGLVGDDSRVVRWAGEKLYGDDRVEVQIWDFAHVNHVGPTLRDATDVQEAMLF